MPSPKKDSQNISNKGGDLTRVQSDATSLALALGAVPLEVTMPHHDKILKALGKLGKVQETDEYRKLVEARYADEITREDFHEAVRVLTNRLDAEGKLD